VCGRRFRFRAGERIHTENSYKYSIDQFQRLARSAGWSPERVWMDECRLFSVHELSSG
jgi:L-histidine Nalpha-methyltransferase